MVRKANLSIPAGNVGAAIVGPLSDSRALYRFKTEDGNWTLSLSSNAVALTTGQYESWEKFSRNFAGAWDAFARIYSPSIIKRVGLRYVNFIGRQKLGISGATWDELLQPYVVGELAIKEIASNVQEVQKVVTFRMPDGSGVKFQHGIAELVGEEQQGYAIDFDFFRESGCTLPDVLPELSRFNARARRALRWCITDRLHRAMEPVNLDSPVAVG